MAQAGITDAVGQQNPQHPASQRFGLSRRDILLLILAFLLTRAAITTAGVLSMRFLPSSEGEEYTHLLDQGVFAPALDMWYRWDAGFYATIATYNYDWINEQRPADDMAFLPVYPLAIHLVSGLTPRGCALSPYLSTCATLGGLAVSNLSLLAAAFLLFDLAQKHFGRATAWRAMLLLLVSPISIFLSGIYTESLFLLLTLLTFWLLERDQFLLAVIAASVACLTRSVGVALFLPLLWVAWTSRPERTIRKTSGINQGRSAVGAQRAAPSVSRLILSFVSPLLFAGYILLAGASVGDPLAFFKTFDATWGRVAGTPIQAFTVYFSGEEVSLFGWRLSWLDLILTLVYLAFSALLLREKETRLWGLFALVAILVPVASGSLLSMPRYGAAVFPFYILLAKWADRFPKAVVIYGAAAALALLFLTRFVTWRWIA